MKVREILYNIAALIVFLLGIVFIIITGIAMIIDNEGLFGLAVLLGLLFLMLGFIVANLNPNKQYD